MDEIELSQSEALERLEIADRHLDAGNVENISWIDLVWIVAAARRGVHHGYRPCVAAPLDEIRHVA